MRRPSAVTGSVSAGLGFGTVREVPVDRLSHAVAEIGAGFEAEQLAGAARINAAARLPVGLAGVPDDAPLEAGELGDDLDEFLDQ